MQPGNPSVPYLDRERREHMRTAGAAAITAIATPTLVSAATERDKGALRARLPGVRHFWVPA